MGRKRKIGKLGGTKNKIMAMSSNSQSSNAGLDHLPDEILTRILEFISPVNIADFTTLVRLEMVSKRFRHCVVGNKKIWENVNELVIGSNPDVPDGQYLRLKHHAAMESFLERVQQKITKVVINADFMSDHDLMEKHTTPLIERFIGKFEIKQMNVHDNGDVAVGSPLFIKLINISKESLESYHFHSIKAFFCIGNHAEIADAFANCSSLKNIRISVFQASWNLCPFVRRLKSLELLEINGYNWFSIFDVGAIFSQTRTFHLQTLRLNNPRVGYHGDAVSRRRLKMLLSQPNQLYIREFEFNYCSYYDDLIQLPFLLDNASYYLTHFKLTFMPYFKFNKMHKIVELLENVIHKRNGDMKISINFKHSDVDQEAKLAIVHGLLDTFDVPHTTEHDGIWEFMRGSLCVNLMLEKIKDRSFICHRYIP